MKCTCRDCGKVMDQERGEVINIVNPWIPDEGYDLCDTCLEKHGEAIISCEHCTDLTERKFLSAKLVPLGFVECPGCGHDVFTGKTAIEYKTMTCKKCGRLIFDPENKARILNEGQEDECYACNICFDAMWEEGSITKCEGCGTWFEVTTLHRDAEVEDFLPCPVCGHDVCEGYTREEAIALMNERELRTGNTAITYVYVNKNGDVQHNREVLPGVLSRDQRELFLKLKNEAPSFIPCQIGLPEVRFLYTPNKFDVAWFRLHSLEGNVLERPTVMLSVDDFFRKYQEAMQYGWVDTLWHNRAVQHRCCNCGKLLTEDVHVIHKGAIGSRNVAWCDKCDKTMFAE